VGEVYILRHMCMRQHAVKYQHTVAHERPVDVPGCFVLAVCVEHLSCSAPAVLGCGCG